jgi:hypothetical protein
LERTWETLVAKGGYGIPSDHPHFYVEDADQSAKIKGCCGNDFRYASKPDANGDRSAVDGAWEMDTDGTPKVNMAKARGVHMDKIRVMRNVQLDALDIPFMRAMETGDQREITRITELKQTLRDIPQTFDLTARTPQQLTARWPIELPAQEI